MPIQLPDLAIADEFDFFKACCRLAPSANRGNWPAEGTTEELDARSDGIWYRLIVNRQSQPEGLHLHLDLFREGSDDETPTKENASVGDITSRIESLAAKDIYVIAKSRFIVQRAELPKTSAISLLLQLGGVPSGPGEKKMLRLAGSLFRGWDPRAQEIIWTVDEDSEPETIVVDVEASLTVPMTDEFLVDFIDPMVAMFGLVILDRIPADKVTQ